MSLESPISESMAVVNRRERLRQCFEAYTNDFPLTEQELQGRLLDVGAARAEFIQYVREELHNSEAMAVDSNPRNINSENADWYICANGKDLPFEDNSFETVIARHCIGGTQAQEIVSELLRVTQRGGRVMFTVITPERERALQASLQERFGDEYDVEEINGVKHVVDWEHRIEVAEDFRLFIDYLSQEHLVEIKGEDNNVAVIIK